MRGRWIAVLALTVSDPDGANETDDEALSQFPPDCVLIETVAVTVVGEAVANVTVCAAGVPPAAATNTSPCGKT